MLMRRTNWPVFAAVAILGPALGLYLGATCMPADWLPWSDDGTASAPERAAASPSPAPETAPAELVMPDGDRLTLDRLAPQRATAIVVMKGEWCPVCQKQLRRLSEGLEQLNRVDAAVFGLNTASPDANRRLQQKLDLAFPVLTDPKRDLHDELDLWLDEQGHAMPGIIFVDEDGRIADIHRGRYPGQKQGRYILHKLAQISEHGD